LLLLAVKHILSALTAYRKMALLIQGRPRNYQLSWASRKRIVYHGEVTGGRHSLGAKRFRGDVVRKIRLQRLFITVFLVITAGGLIAKAQETTSHTNAAITPKSLKWQPFSPGVEVAVLQGTLTENGPFTIRLRLRAGTEIPPHWHTTDENMTILKGVFGLGVGDTFEKLAIQYMAPGAFISLPKGIHHFALSKTDCVVQVHGVGPFVMTFVQR